MKKFMHAYLFQMKETIQKKGFIISTLIMVAVVFGIGFFNYQSTQKKEIEKEEITILDVAKDYSIDESTFEEQFGETYTLKQVDTPKEDVIKDLEKGKLDAFYVLSQQNNLPIIQQYYKTQSNSVITLWIEQNIKEQYIVHVAKEKNLTNEDIAELFAPIQTEFIEQVDVGKSYGLVYPMIYAMLLFIMGFGQSIAVNVASEKSSKVMEILLPKIHPIYSLYSKIFGALSTGLLQFAILITSFWVTIQLGWTKKDAFNIVGFNINLQDMHLSTLLWFIFFFITGFLFYGLIYATIGAMVNKVEELNSLVTPVVFLLMGAFGLGIYSIFEPNATIAIIAAYIPPFTPIVLFARILLGEAGLWEILISLTIFFATFAVVTYFCQKGYKQAVSGGKLFKWKKKK